MVLAAMQLPGCASKVGTTTQPRREQGSVPIARFSSDERARIEQAQPHVQEAARRYGVDPVLVNAVIWVESRFRADARSPAGARGLMQLMPATAGALAKQLGARRSRPHDPAFNVHAGTLYLAKLSRRFDGNEMLTLAAYHGGAANVRKWMAGTGLPTFSLAYVEAVRQAKLRFSHVESVQPRSTTPTVETPGNASIARVSAPSRPPVEARAPASDPVGSSHRVRGETSKPTQVIDSDVPFAVETSAPQPDVNAEQPEPPQPRERPEVGIGILPSILDD